MATAIAKRRITPETKAVETLLSKHFNRVEAYRFSAASIRLRIIDERFRGLRKSARLDMVERWLAKLPKETETDIIFIVPIAAGEEKLPDFAQMNRDFEHPRKTRL